MFYKHFLMLLFGLFFTAGCVSQPKYPASISKSTAVKISSTPTYTSSTQSLSNIPTSTPGARDPKCGQMLSLEAISPHNASEISLLCTLRIPDYQRSRVSQCSLSFNTDGSLLAGVCGLSPAPVWEVQSGDLSFTLFDDASHRVGVAFSRSGDFLAIGDFSGEVHLFDTHSGMVHRILATLPSPVWDMVFYPSADQMVVATFNDGVFLLDSMGNPSADSLGDGNQTQTLSVDISSDGDSLAYGTVMSGMWVVKADTGEIISHMSIPAPVGDVAFSSDGKWLAAGSDDNLLRIWSAGDYSQVQTLNGHESFVNGVAFSPDSLLIATGSKDRTIAVWDVVTGELLTRLKEHTSDVLRLVFNPQGTMFASISWDGTVRLWGVLANE